jgi:hypothetical protein
MTANEKFKREVINTRVAVLKAMDETIRNMNDENAMEPWLMCGVPDGACEEDYEDIASDHESYIEMVGLFAEIVKDYAEEDF